MNDRSKDAGGAAYLIPEGSTWAQAWKIAAVVGVIGLGLCAAGWSADPRRFAFAWLFAFMTFLTLGLGAIFFIVVTHLTAAHWSVTARRTAEFFAAAVPVFALLFVPIALNVEGLYEWASPAAESGGADHAGQAPHGAQERPSGAEALLGPPVARAQGRPGEGPGSRGAAAAGRTSAHASPQHAAHAEVMAHKAPWLAKGFWLGRAGLYLLTWMLLALFYYRSSTRQDVTRDKLLTVRMVRWAPLSMIALALSLTFASFDWMMSLEPAWYSTIYGVYVWAGSAVSICALVTVVALGLRARGHLGDAMNTEHFHDLGKLTFGFVVFWAYVGFSQMMLIWYANIPEETIYYQYRWHGYGWRGLSWLLIVGYFALPFLFLISRNIKRRLPLLAFGSMWMLVMHAVDIYWFIMPNVERGRLSLHWLDLAALMAVGGIYFATVFSIMRRHPLVPVGDPRLARCLRHVST